MQSYEIMSNDKDLLQGVIKTYYQYGLEVSIHPVHQA